MTEPQKLTDLVPVEVLTEVNTAIAVLEIQGPAITEALGLTAPKCSFECYRCHGVRTPSVATTAGGVRLLARNAGCVGGLLS